MPEQVTTVLLNKKFMASDEPAGVRRTVGHKGVGIASRLRPQSLPQPQVINDVSNLSGYVAADYWEREDAFLIHPPAQSAICAICRGVPFSKVVHVAAAVHASRVDGPIIGFSIGIAPADSATAENWEDFVGPVVSVQPGDWGVVTAELEAPTLGNSCDLLLATRVLSRGGNDKAWALFRRFAFTTTQITA